MNKSKWVLGTIAAVVALVAVAGGLVLAFDGDGDGSDGGPSTSNIRTEKGLAVAAAIGNLDVGSSDDGAETDTDETSAAPAADRSSRAIDIGKLGGIGFAPPQVTSGGTGITVSGYGSATADADSAVIDFYFSRSGYIDPVPLPEPVPPTDGSTGEPGVSFGPDATPYTQGEVVELTEADLQPVIDAIVAAGVARDDIEFVGQGYYDPYYASASLRVTVGDADNVDAVVDAANGASGDLGDIFQNGQNVSYTVSDCAALEIAAIEAAVEDANERGGAFAGVLGVGLGEIIGASQYSYSEFGGSACGGFGGGYPVYDKLGLATGSQEVVLYANVTITFAIQ